MTFPLHKDYRNSTPQCFPCLLVSSHVSKSLTSEVGKQEKKRRMHTREKGEKPLCFCAVRRGRGRVNEDPPSYFPMPWKRRECLHGMRGLCSCNLTPSLSSPPHATAWKGISGSSQHRGHIPAQHFGSKARSQPLLVPQQWQGPARCWWLWDCSTIRKEQQQTKKENKQRFLILA